MLPKLKRYSRAASRVAKEVLAALPYRFGADPLRYIVSTLKELPAAAPQGRGTLVLFSHYDPQDEVDEYVRYYLEQLKKQNATIVFVSGSPNLKAASADKIQHLCAGIYTRETLSADFGTHHLGWSILRSKGWTLDQFDRFALVNDSVYGPLFPLDEMFATFHDADMYGALENRQIAMHLQSYFLVWDLNEKTRPFLENFWKRFQYVAFKRRLIPKYEVGLSTSAVKAGLRLKPYISAETVEHLAATLTNHPNAGIFASGEASYVHELWDGLVEHLRFPFIKTWIVKQGSRHPHVVAHLESLVTESTPYPYELIRAHRKRLGL